MSKVKNILGETYNMVRNSLVLFGMIFLSAIVISMPVLMLLAAVMWVDGGF
jgi:hypothetical protein